MNHEIVAIYHTLLQADIFSIGIYVYIYMYAEFCIHLEIHIHMYILACTRMDQKLLEESPHPSGMATNGGNRCILPGLQE